MDGLLKSMCAEGAVVTDGAWGTELQARGLQIGQCADEWNLIHPLLVSHVANSYVLSGSRVILTNTFGASRIALERYDLAEKAVQINKAGAGISRNAARDRAAVFGSIGPSSKALFMGEVTEQQLIAAFEEQAHALAEGRVDGLVVETMCDLQEATLAVKAAASTGLPVIACMVYGAGVAGDRTITGVCVEDAVEGLISAGASAVGSNCGFGARQMVPLCRKMRALTRLPIWIKPNAGLPEVEDGRAVYKTTPGVFADDCLALVEAGADFIGGCCGTGPQHIRALGSLMSERIEA